MDVSARKNLISSAPSTESDARLWVLGQWKNIPVLRVPVSALALNIDNRRFAAERQLFEQQLGHSLDPENSEDDALSVEAILLDRDLVLDGSRVVGKPNKDYLALRQDWQRRKQETPFWILADGTVRNGNRRLAMLRRLQREEGAEGYEYVEAVVLDTLGINELAIFEMEQREQLTEDYKVRYTDINLLLAIKAAAEDKEIDWYDDESISTVAGELQHVMRNNPGYAVVQLYAIKYMDAYLDDLGEAGRYDKLMGLIERFRDVGRTMRTVEANDPDRAPAMLNVLFAAVSSGLKYQEIRQIRRLFNDDRDGFDKIVKSVRKAEEQWEQPTGEEALGEPEVVNTEDEDPDATDSTPEPSGPVVTNYPKNEIKGILDDAIDRYESAQIKDVLKIVREVNNRLDALISADSDRLGPALAVDDTSVLRAAVEAMSSWFEKHKASIK